jgi:orotidine-5'-phosphate decarboxylase
MDVSSAQEARQLYQELGPHIGLPKIGLELFTSVYASLLSPQTQGNEAVEMMHDFRAFFRLLGGNFFADIKQDDIPETLRKVTLAIQALAPRYLNVHASAGPASIKAVIDNKGESQVLGVTVLTTISPDDCVSIFGETRNMKVRAFANMLLELGADGIICSAQELEYLAGYPELAGLKKVTPGIRPDWKVYAEKLGLPAPEVKKDDQVTAMTPAQAIEFGAHALVIGRPLTKPEVGTRIQIARLIAEEIGEAEARRAA